MNIKITAESIKLLIFLALIPVFIFSVSLASKAIYVAEEYTPPVYEQSNLRSLRVLRSDKTIVTLRVETAGSAEEQTLGLSGRKSLPQNRGMLFVFPAADNYSFWMKDMNFGLDFIWINDNIVTEITKNVMPVYVKSPDVFSSRDKVDKVLEINAGAAERLDIKVGDVIEF